MSEATPRVDARIGILWRGNPATRERVTASNNRLAPVFEALTERGIAAEAVVYADEIVDEVRQQLLALDGVLVWVDPISNGEDRSQLDPLLSEVAAAGVWVSARPGVILKMGTKEVLFHTQHLSWGADTAIYRSEREFREQFPARLASSGPRVLKQYRGNGGNGVWKVELIAARSGGVDEETPVRVLHALRGSVEEEMRLGDFLARCEMYFAGDGRLIDQAFQPRLADGMIRCYLSQGEVVGFGHQLIRALLSPPPPEAGPEAAQPGPRIMHGPEAPAFQVLRRQMESEWVPPMQALLGIETESLPAIWDADFLYGPKTATGEDTYILCEINVSAVSPFPDEAIAKLADAAARCVRTAKQQRRRTP